MIINGNVDERQCTARFDKVACNNLPNYVLNWQHHFHLKYQTNIKGLMVKKDFEE